MKKIKNLILILALMIVPVISFAQTVNGRSLTCSNGITDVATLFNLAICMINNFIIPLIIALALLIFIWGVVQFIGNADNEEKRQKGRDFMVS
jgi:hypothetical protein